MELQEKLRGIETAKTNPESLRSTINFICNMCRQLENLGVDIDNEATKLDIISKLPHRKKQELKWWLISEQEKTTVSELMEKMKRLALKAELAPSHEPRSSTNFQPRRFDSNGTYSNFNQRNTRFDSNPLSPNSQPLCDGDRWQGNCDKFITPAEKLKQLRLKNYCTKCSRYHDTKNCFSKIICCSCDGDHYAFLCKEGFNRSTAFINVEKKKGMLLTKDVTIINPVTKKTTETVVILEKKNSVCPPVNNVAAIPVEAQTIGFTPLALQ
uniref:Uncharacterized protein n=1 Tax=Panagrolaimus superbus TaxID=310955 RepID=A0A914XUQ3_9BILA